MMAARSSRNSVRMAVKAPMSNGRLQKLLDAAALRRGSSQPWLESASTLHVREEWCKGQRTWCNLRLVIDEPATLPAKFARSRMGTRSSSGQTLFKACSAPCPPVFMSATVQVCTLDGRLLAEEGRRQYWRGRLFR